MANFWNLTFSHPIVGWERSPNFKYLSFPIAGSFPPWWEIIYPAMGSTGLSLKKVFYFLRSNFLNITIKNGVFEMRKKMIRRKLKRLKFEVRELLGMLSLYELTTNWNLVKRFQNIDEELLYV